MCFSVHVIQNLARLTSEFGAVPEQASFDAYARKSAHDAKKFKPLAEHPRIYPNYWAPIIWSDAGKLVISPMRYRVHPSWSEEEMPANLNLFNARRDGLLTRKTWKHLLMKNHGLLVFERFYEWVLDKDTGKKKVISFTPRGRKTMWCPVLFDHWRATDGSDEMTSFALITDDPPAEVLAAGHDRCPIFLRSDLIQTWLNPAGKSALEMLSVLENKEPAYFEHQLATAS